MEKYNNNDKSTGTVGTKTEKKVHFHKNNKRKKMHPKKAYYRKKYEKTSMSVTHAALHTIKDRNEVLRNPLNPNLCSIWHLFARKKTKSKEREGKTK